MDERLYFNSGKKNPFHKKKNYRDVDFQIYSQGSFPVVKVSFPDRTNLEGKTFPEGARVNETSVIWDYAQKGMLIYSEQNPSNAKSVTYEDVVDDIQNAIDCVLGFGDGTYFIEGPESNEGKEFENAKKHGADNSIYPFSIGGSELPIIEQTSHFATPRRLQEKLLGTYVEHVDAEKKDMFAYGHHFETSIGNHNAWILEKKFSYLGVKVSYAEERHEWRHKKWPHMNVHIDGLLKIEDGYIDVEETKAKNEIVIKAKPGHVSIYLAEVKSTSVFSNIWKENLSVNKVPDTYQPQLLGCMRVGNFTEGAVLLAHNCNGRNSEKDFRAIFMPYDQNEAERILDNAEDFIQRTLANDIYKFDEILNRQLAIKEYVEELPPVDPKATTVTISNANEGYVKDYLQEKKALEELEAILAKKQEAFEEKIRPQKEAFEKETELLNEDIKAAKKKVESAEVLLLPLIGNSSEGTYETDDAIHTFVVDRSKFSFDKKVKAAFQENYPEAYNYVSNFAPNPKIKHIVKTKDKEDKNE